MYSIAGKTYYNNNIACNKKKQYNKTLITLTPLLQ